MLTEERRAATVTALTEVEAIFLDRQLFRRSVLERPALAERVLRVLAQRLRDTTGQLAAQVSAGLAKNS